MHSGSLWFLFIVEVSPSGWGWAFGLSTKPTSWVFGWLEKLVLVFWWVELDFFSLECTGVSSSEF